MNKDYIFVQKKEKAHLFPNIFVIGLNYTHTIKKILKGVSFGETLVEIKNGVMHWYASAQGLQESGDKAMELIQNDPDYIKNIRTKFERVAPQMNKFTAKIFNSDVSKLTNKQIWEIFDKYLTKYEQIYLYSEPITLVLEESWGKYLKEYLHTRIKNKQKLNEYYNLLISPQEKSFVKHEEDEFIKLALKKNPAKYLDDHISKYCWVPYDYGIYLWDKKYFTKVLNKLLVQKNLKQKLVTSDKYFKELPKKQAALIKELKIDKYHQKLFQAMRDAAYLQDYKKEVFTKSHYHMNKLLEEVAGRFKVPKEHFQYYLPQEVKLALTKNKKVSKTTLAKRYKESYLMWCDNTIKYISKKELTSHLQQNAPAKTKLEGNIACAGKYTGRVKIVKNSAQVGKVHQGDILVTAMTSPEYVPAMRKAGAIITDHGGVMCHAAIVSRELGVPCVVGTRTATQTLKDNEIVTVNANHNSVKIYKK